MKKVIGFPVEQKDELYKVFREFIRKNELNLKCGLINNVGVVEVKGDKDDFDMIEMHKEDLKVKFMPKMTLGGKI